LIDKLKNIKLFKGLDDSDLYLISKFTNIKSYHRGNIIYYQEDIKKDLYYLKRGKVRVYKVDRFDNEIFLYNILSDDLITKISGLYENVICCFGNIECEEDSEVLVIDYEKFSKFCIQRPTVLLTMIEIFAKKSMMLECLINRELVYDGVSKVAFMIVNEPEIFTKLKKREIAYQLNIQPETLSRILNKLSRKRLISVDKHKINIIDIAGLRAMYE
jgi:CRP/FNR family transcriptional regulator